jgi:hypothetical protein
LQKGLKHRYVKKELRACVRVPLFPRANAL